MRPALLSLVLCLLVGCGFQLRGTEEAEALSFDSIYIELSDVDSDILRTLEEKFERSNVQVTDRSSSAQYVAFISGERNSRRAIAHSSGQMVSEFGITRAVNLHLVNLSGDVLIVKEEVLAERFYVLNAQVLDSSFQEERLLLEEMQKDISEQIFRRINASIHEYQNKTR